MSCTPTYISRTCEGDHEQNGARRCCDQSQVNRDKFDASICVGTCGVYRREALAPFGGTAAIGYSEDVHTGFNCIQLGYKVRDA